MEPTYQKGGCPDLAGAEWGERTAGMQRERGDYIYVVVVVVDSSSASRCALLWALSHAVQSQDTLSRRAEQTDDNGYFVM